MNTNRKQGENTMNLIEKTKADNIICEILSVNDLSLFDEIEKSKLRKAVLEEEYMEVYSFSYKVIRSSVKNLVFV
jgi:hypothetical protein